MAPPPHRPIAPQVRRRAAAYIHNSPTMLEVSNSFSVLANDRPPRRCCSSSAGSTMLWEDMSGPRLGTGGGAD